MRRRILILMSDTGGGHRAAAEAIRDALYSRYGKKTFGVSLIDVFKEYSPFPFRYFPELYPMLVNNSKRAWELGFKYTNDRQIAKVMIDSLYMGLQGAFKRVFHEYQPHLVVCVHSLMVRPAMRVLRQQQQRPPFITVVTDLVSTHVIWYDRSVERCLVPTPTAYERAIKAGLDEEKVRLTGLPVHPDFERRLPEKSEARKQLGWDPRLPTVLAVGGGEGMGPLYQIAREIDSQKLKCQLAIIAGRNADLKANLEACEWNQPTYIYPFVHNMPVLMAASDILVTKAGPATISEACIAGLPMVISDFIPGQEDGNVLLVVENGAGVYAPGPKFVAACVAGWLAEGKEGLARRSEAARSLGHPEAVWSIAEEVSAWAMHGPVYNPDNIPASKRSIALKDMLNLFDPRL